MATVSIDNPQAPVALPGSTMPGIPAPTASSIYAKAAGYTGGSISDFLAIAGQKNDFNSRTALATKYGISNYTGTATQNTQLLNILRAQAKGNVNPLGIPKDIGTTLGVKSPSTTTPIPANGLPAGNQALSSVLGVSVGTNTVNSDIAGLLSLYGAATPSGAEVDQLSSALNDAVSQLNKEPGDLQAEMDKQGVGAAYEQVKSLNLQAAQLKGKIDAFDQETNQLKDNLAQQSIPMNLITGQQAALERTRSLQKSAMASELASTLSLAQAYNNNAVLGEKLAHDAIDMKYAPVKNQITTLQEQIKIAQGNMTKEQSTNAKIIDAMLKMKQEEISTQSDNEKQIMTQAVNAAANGAPLDIVNKMKAAPDAAAAASIGNKYLKGNLEKVGKGSGSGNGTGDTLSGSKLSFDEGGGLQFADKKGNAITAGQYAAANKQNLLSVLRQSKAGHDQGELSDLQSVVNDVNSGKYTITQAYSALQQAKGYIFNGITQAQFAQMLGLKEPKKTTTSSSPSVTIKNK